MKCRSRSRKRPETNSGNMILNHSNEKHQMSGCCKKLEENDSMPAFIEGQDRGVTEEPESFITIHENEQEDYGRGNSLPRIPKV